MKPSDFIGDSVNYDSCGQMIFANNGNSQQLLLSVRGWGAIQNLFKAENEASVFQDELGEWIADAINQKLKRELNK